MNLRKQIREVVNRSLRKTGLEIRGYHYDSETFMLSPKFASRMTHLASTAISSSLRNLTDLSSNTNQQTIEKLISDFNILLKKDPVRQSFGGAGYNTAVELYVITQLFKPDLIIESGVYQGFTTWVFRQAARTAKIFCFDLTFSNLIYKDPDSSYVNHDWMKVNFEFPKSERTICFFDDHVSHEKRIGEAIRRGFRFLIFDDDFPTHAICAAGTAPALPTVSMILDEGIEDGETIEWMTCGSEWQYQHDEKRVRNCRRHIRTAAKMPALSEITGYEDPSRLTVVELVS